MTGLGRAGIGQNRDGAESESRDHLCDAATVVAASHHSQRKMFNGVNATYSSKCGEQAPLSKMFSCGGGSVGGAPAGLVGSPSSNFNPAPTPLAGAQMDPPRTSPPASRTPTGGIINMLLCALLSPFQPGHEVPAPDDMQLSMKRGNRTQLVPVGAAVAVRYIRVGFLPSRSSSRLSVW